MEYFPLSILNARTINRLNSDEKKYIIGNAVVNRLAFAKYLNDPLYDELVQEALPFILKDEYYKDMAVEGVYEEVERRYNDVIS